jgi:hypothetical protein
VEYNIERLIQESGVEDDIKRREQAGGFRSNR